MSSNCPDSAEQDLEFLQLSVPKWLLAGTQKLYVCIVNHNQPQAAATLHKAQTLAESDAEPCRVGESCSCAPALVWMGSHCHVIPRLLWVRLRSAGDTLLQSDSDMTAALV